MGARLVIVKGPLSGVVLVLEEGTRWSIGKDPDKNDIPLEDAELADSQVVITKEDGEYYIRNLDAEHPVLVNDKAIEDKTPLKDADVIQFGSNHYSFFSTEFSPDDLVYDFDLSHENDVSEPSGGKQSPASDMSTSSQSDVAAPSDKDQKLAEEFLSSAKQEKKEASVQEPPSSDEVKTTAEQDVHADDIHESTKEAKSASVQPPQPSDMDSAKDAPKDIPAEEKPSESVEQQTGPVEDKQPEQEGSSEKTEGVVAKDSSAETGQGTSNGKESDEKKEEPKDIEEPKDAEGKEEPKGGEGKEAVESKESPEEKVSEENKEKVEASGENKEASIEEDKKEDSPDEKDGSDEKEEGDSTEEKEGEKDEEGKAEEKQEVLTPFNIQDLFRFDQGIFPAEVNDAAQKNVSVDLSQPSRFLLKVLAGANIGAEFHLNSGQTYILGSDANAADIVFNDMSVSHRHAKIIVGSDGGIVLEDLGSKNGTIIEGRKIEHSSTLSANQVVALGTTLFLLVDHQAPTETVLASFAPEDYGLFGRPQDAEAIAEQKAQEEEEKQRRSTLPTGSFILTLFIGGLAILFGVGTASLFHTKELVPMENINFQEDIERVIDAFPAVRYTFNKNNGQLFLIGHVKNSIDKSELLYKIDALSFVKSVDDNVIDDEAVWQEVNILLSRKPEFKGVSMHSPEPGQFVITGYLKTEEQAVCLTDYLNVHFNYLSLLENRVVVETLVLKAIAGHLLQSGFANIQIAFVNGEVILTGYVNNEDKERFQQVVQEITAIQGVRLVKNFVVALPVEEGIIDLNLRYPNRYRVTGYSKYGDVSINVVVNGRILMRGDLLDGMTVTSIQPHAIFLEKEGLKYKIEYNK